MKRIATLLAITIFFLTGCAVAGEATKPAPKPERAISADDLVTNIKRQIAEYDGPITQAKKALEATPGWKAYLEQRQVYNDALKLFKEQDKAAASLDEFKTLRYLEKRQMELKRLLEGGK
jgi:nitrous oxide reductase accessory protein NosL